MILSKGRHNKASGKFCAMEAAALLNKEPHTDHPKCSCTVIADFVVHLNDGLPSDEERSKLLYPFVRKIIGSKAKSHVVERRRKMCQEWVMSVVLPDMIRAIPGHSVLASNVAGLAHAPIEHVFEYLKGRFPEPKPEKENEYDSFQSCGVVGALIVGQTPTWYQMFLLLSRVRQELIRIKRWREVASVLRQSALKLLDQMLEEK